MQTSRSGHLEKAYRRNSSGMSAGQRPCLSIQVVWRCGTTFNVCGICVRPSWPFNGRQTVHCRDYWRQLYLLPTRDIRHLWLWLPATIGLLQTKKSEPIAEIPATADTIWHHLSGAPLHVLTTVKRTPRCREIGIASIPTTASNGTETIATRTSRALEVPSIASALANVIPPAIMANVMTMANSHNERGWGPQQARSNASEAGQH